MTHPLVCEEHAHQPCNSIRDISMQTETCKRNLISIHLENNGHILKFIFTWFQLWPMLHIK